MKNPFKRKEKKKEPPADLIPRGLLHSIIPESYLQKVGDNWDKNNPLYVNKIIIK